MAVKPTHPGDERYRGIVQAARIRMTPSAEGEPQTITFAARSKAEANAS